MSLYPFFISDSRSQTFNHLTGCKHQCKSLSVFESDVILRHQSGSALPQVMASCLTAPIHYLNQWRLIISKSSGKNLRDISQDVTQPLYIKTMHPKFRANLTGTNELILITNIFVFNPHYTLYAYTKGWDLAKVYAKAWNLTTCILFENSSV